MVQATSDFINPTFILSKCFVLAKNITLAFVEYRYNKNNPQKYFKSPDILNTIVKSNEHLPSGIARLES